VGFATTGTGNIGAFTATNTTSAPVTATVTVVATANGCQGPAQTFTITVNPSPAVNTVSSVSYCNGASAPAIVFGSPTAGAVFSYTSSVNVGFGTSGTGNIGAFTATNTGSTPVVATVSVQAIANGCAGPVQTFSVTVTPSPSVNTVTSATYCNGATVPTITFGSPVAGATFSYTSSTNVGFSTTGTGNINSFVATNGSSAPVTTTVTVVATANGCPGPAQTFTITVNPSPVINAVSNVTVCNGQTASAITFSSPTAGATFSYSSSTNVGFGTAGVGNIPSFVAVNNTSSPITTTVTVTASANGCSGPSQSFVITVNPSPTVNAVSSVVYCANQNAPAINFSSPTAGATFSYTSSTNVGFGTTGTGNIGAFTATNNTSAPVTATVTVVATANGCPGPALMFTVTVNPQPTVNTVNNVVACSGQTVPAITFGSPTAGTTFSYTATNNVGFATTGTSGIPTFVASNTTAAPIVSTVTVVATANGCQGPAQTFTVTVNPGPTVNSVSSVVVCTGATAGPITFSSPTSGATFSYTSSTNVGFGTTGTGNIGQFTAVNNTSDPITATITVVATANGCQGQARTFTITVNPTPIVNNILSLTVCNGSPVSAIPFSSETAGTSFSYTASNNIGFATTGNNVTGISAFTATNNTASPISTTVTVTGSANGCPGPARIFVITVNPSPAVENATVNPISSYTYCNGAPATGINFTSSTTGTTFNYASSIDVGFGTTGTGNIPPYTATNLTTEPVIATVTVAAVANGCAGPTRSFNVTVNPTPTVNAVASQTICNGQTVAAIPLTSPTPGAVLSYTASANIGFTTTGTGSIGSFTATNNTANPITATITVVASIEGCQGPARTFTITVNPSPAISPVSNITVCNGAPVSAINVTSATPGAITTYTSSGNVGFGTAGTGNIGAFTAQNNTTAPVTVTVTASAQANGCQGPAQTFTVTVIPTATVNPLTNVAVCAGATASPIVFTSPVAGATFSYTSSTNVGFGTTGTGNINSFTAVNSGSAPVTATVTVVATTNGCPGPAQTFTVTVNPSPVVNAVASLSVCNGAPVSAIAFSSPTPGATFQYASSTNIG
ncbi:beta strand repeat-containing protein, partial [Nibrella viscosa]|uniref:beta strand repeat-containing protein n=1 Tax=Nibrella viscosa TaxID=1084524 RepID=UPI0031E65745